MIVRHMAFFASGKKFARASNVQATFLSNSQRLIADEGDIGGTNGPKQVKVSVSSIEPVDGNSMGLVQKMLTDQRIEFSLFPVDGKIAHCKDVTVTQCEFTGEAANGTNTGKFEFEGGKPDLTG